jgi:AraC-like DNA-binding protein
VTGPFQTARVTSADLLERWRALTGAQGRMSDPEFARYVETTLTTLLLERDLDQRFLSFVEAMAALVGARGDADATFAAIQSLFRELAPARLAERSWEIARSVVDRRTSRAWASPHRSPHLAGVGLGGFPEHVLVGLMVGTETGTDPLEEVLIRDGFQRAVVELARSTGEVASGRIGAHGITLLCTSRGSAASTRRFLLDLGERATQIARKKFGLRLHLGLCARPCSIAEQYVAALAAAEIALAKGVRVVNASDEPEAVSLLGPMRRELQSLVDERPQALPARFERYLEAVAIRSSHRLDVARAHVEAGFERIAEALRDSGTLEAKSLSGLYSGLEHSAGEAVTLNELFVAYRRAVHDIVDVLSRPTQARRDRSLQRAEEYLRTHYAEPLSLKRVAHVAGFAPSYFSELFRVKQSVTFERYLMQLRVERAKQLLNGTMLNLQRIAQLSGFSTRHYLGRVFKRVTGETPLGFRERVREQRSPEKPVRKRRAR